MKKLSVLLAAILLLSCFSSAALASNTNIGPFQAVTANSQGYTVSQWMATSEKRALLTVCLARDLMDCTEFSRLRPQFSMMRALQAKSYVVGDFDGSGLLTVLLEDPQTGSILNVIYSPSMGRAACTIIEGLTLGFGSKVDAGTFARISYGNPYTNSYMDVVRAQSTLDLMGN